MRTKRGAVVIPLRSRSTFLAATAPLRASSRERVQQHRNLQVTAVLTTQEPQPWQFDPLRLFDNTAPSGLGSNLFGFAAPRGRAGTPGKDSGNDFESFFKSEVGNAGTRELWCSSSMLSGSRSLTSATDSLDLMQVPNKIVTLLLLLLFSRVGVYIPLPGLDREVR